MREEPFLDLNQHEWQSLPLFNSSADIVVQVRTFESEAIGHR